MRLSPILVSDVVPDEGPTRNMLICLRLGLVVPVLDSWSTSALKLSNATVTSGQRTFELKAVVT